MKQEYEATIFFVPHASSAQKELQNLYSNGWRLISAHPEGMNWVYFAERKKDK